MDYFTISWYIVYAIAIFFVPVLLFRLFRTIPYYVKNGNMGSDDNDLMFAWDKDSKGRIYNLFNETHPGAILMDAVTLTGAGVALFIAWGLVPIVAAGALIVYGITKYAQYLRNRHLKKQEFVGKLKG